MSCCCFNRGSVNAHVRVDKDRCAEAWAGCGCYMTLATASLQAVQLCMQCWDYKALL